MRLVEIMQSLGDRLGILEKALPATVRSPVKLQTRTVTLAELMTEIRSEELRTLAELPAELSVPFPQLFQAAGITPAAQGWTVEKLAEVLKGDSFAGLQRPDIQKRILEALAADKVEVQEVVRDAVARDKALDAFEAFARKKLKEREITRERKIAEIDAGIESLQQERATLLQKSEVDQEQWREWRRRKRQVEQDLARTVGYLIEDRVITTDEDEH